MWQPKRKEWIQARQKTPNLAYMHATTSRGDLTVRAHVCVCVSESVACMSECVPECDSRQLSHLRTSSSSQLQVPLHLKYCLLSFLSACLCWRPQGRYIFQGMYRCTSLFHTKIKNTFFFTSLPRSAIYRCRLFFGVSYWVLEKLCSGDVSRLSVIMERPATLLVVPWARKKIIWKTWQWYCFPLISIQQLTLTCRPYCKRCWCLVKRKPTCSQQGLWIIFSILGSQSWFLSLGPPIWHFCWVFQIKTSPTAQGKFHIFPLCIPELRPLHSRCRQSSGAHTKAV